MSSRSANRLFEDPTPPGFEYRSAFLSQEDEALLLTHVRQLPFENFEMRGAVARRRVAFFGETYDREDASPMPLFLMSLREALSAWAGVAAEAFAMALVNEYRPASPIGWHRDAPQYGIVAGVSLLSTCRMRFRPYVAASATSGRRRTTHEVVLEPRSAYLMRGAARQAYEHHIPPVADLRYSITFRTLRRG